MALANAIGNGVADDKLIYTYVPDLIRYYLREEPIIANVDTWRLEEDAAREEVLDRLDELVVKPVDGSGGKGIVIGPAASAEELDALRRRVTERPARLDRPAAGPAVHRADPDRGAGLEPRHVDLRPFAVNSGDDVWVLPGGLTRVALPEGELVVNSSQGGGSKDTWVLSPPAARCTPPDASRRGLDERRRRVRDRGRRPPTSRRPRPEPPAAPPGAATRRAQPPPRPEPPAHAERRAADRRSAPPAPSAAGPSASASRRSSSNSRPDAGAGDRRC